MGPIRGLKTKSKIPSNLIKSLKKSPQNLFLAKKLQKSPQNFFVACNKVLTIFPIFLLQLQQSPQKFFLESKRNWHLQQCYKG